MLAGNRADEYNFFACPPDEARAKIDVMRRVAGDRHVEATVMGPVLVGHDDAEYQDRLAKAAGDRDISPDELEERWTTAGLIVGAPSRVKDSIAALEDAGVDRMYVQWIDLDDLDGMKSSFDVVLS
jgi:alkanesulfonate monooxygenase SsuD/methylene tetrahydromethanopterin reductase-like flavin-dependent oxidoreductase (luciferase family)